MVTATLALITELTARAEMEVMPETPELPPTWDWVQARAACSAREFFERLYGDGPGSARELGEKFLPEFADEFRLAV